MAAPGKIKVWKGRAKMARPRKMETEEMIRLVDSYFTTEAAGNPAKLKCSCLEGFAERNGYKAKAYDFRRNAKVRAHMEELAAMVLNENGMQMMLGDAYKSMDVSRMLKARRDPDELRMVLGEMDDYWKQVYERSVQISGKNKELQQKLHAARKSGTELEHQLEELKAKGEENAAANNKLTAENRYLRKMLRTYLYPALANEILQQEELLENADTRITHEAGKLIDGRFPSAFSESAAEDARQVSSGEAALEKMWKGLEDE